MKVLCVRLALYWLVAEEKKECGFFFLMQLGSFLHGDGCALYKNLVPPACNIEKWPGLTEVNASWASMNTKANFLLRFL